MPGYSYSGISSNGFVIEPTEKMKLGTKVHSYLLDPKNYDFTDFNLVRPLATAVQNTLGLLLKHAFPEVTLTAHFKEEGFMLPYKGRADILIPNRMIIDLKVSELEMERGIKHFGRDYQVTGYCLGADVPLGIIIQIHPKTKAIQVKQVNLVPDWWAYQTKKRGQVMI